MTEWNASARETVDVLQWKMMTSVDAVSVAQLSCMRSGFTIEAQSDANYEEVSWWHS